MNTLAWFAATGLGAGWAFFASLRWLARRLAFGSVPWLTIGLVQLLRIVAVVVLLWACARQGAGALVAAACGIVLARVLLVAATRRQETPR